MANVADTLALWSGLPVDYTIDKRSSSTSVPYLDWTQNVVKRSDIARSNERFGSYLVPNTLL